MTDQVQQDSPGKRTVRLVSKLVLATVAMFGFGFALVPMYDVICDITGLNGKTSGRYEGEVAEASSGASEEERLITVQFMTQPNADMEWDFRPTERQVKVRPGEVRIISYRATNPTDRVMVGQAIPSIAPNTAAKHMNKIECFCFEEQTLEPGQSVEMPLRFFIDEDLPERITKLTLSYSLFDITDYEAGEELARK